MFVNTRPAVVLPNQRSTRRYESPRSPSGNAIGIAFWWASLPAVGVYTKDFQLLCRYLEFPSIYQKDRIRGYQQAARPGETEAQARERGMKEFAAMQASPFFDLWASVAVDEILSALHRKAVLGAV